MIRPANEGIEVWLCVEPFVPGEQQGHDLVAYLRFVDSVARALVARADQAIEDVAVARTLAASGRNRPVHDAVQASFGCEVGLRRDSPTCNPAA